MAKYSDPLSPWLAKALFDRVAGNYVIHHGDGKRYPGRQGPGVPRISTHLRKNPDVVAVEFMRDHKGDHRARAQRELQTFAKLQATGIPMRNRITPSMPRSSAGGGAGILVVAGIAGLGLLLAAFVKQNKAPAQ